MRTLLSSMGVDIMDAHIDVCQYDPDAGDRTHRRGLLPAVPLRPPRRRERGAARVRLQGPRGAGAAPPGQPDRGAGSARGLCLQSDGAARTLAADREPSPEGARRGGHPGPRATWQMGLLRAPCRDLGARERRLRTSSPPPRSGLGEAPGPVLGRRLRNPPRLIPRDREAEHRPLPGRSLEPETTAERLRALVREVEAEADAAGRPRGGLVHLVEAVEDLRVELQRDAEALVLDAQHEALVGGGCTDRD